VGDPAVWFGDLGADRGGANAASANRLLRQEIQELGLECSLEEPCKAYFEITGLETAGIKLFVAGNFHTEKFTLESVLLMSEDGGATWIEPHPRVRGASLEQIQFIDFENGWVSGLVAGSIAKDPFLLKTADGGKTWRRLPVFEDTEYATIEHFWFESKTQGQIVLNRRGQGTARFHRMETMTGGDSWVPREMTPKAPPPKRVRTGMSFNADWRVRADATAKAFRIEHRVAGRWSTASLFAYEGGVCKPKPPPPPPPPPAEEKKPDARQPD
jgi:photosystem II stability/assembly factor-like uncharacterized protein